MKVIVDKCLFFALTFLLFSCSQNSNTQLEKDQQKIDSLSNELEKVKQQPNSNDQNNSSPKSIDNLNNSANQDSIKYYFVQIIFEKRFFTVRGSLGAYTISEEDGLRRSYSPENVEVQKRQFISDIEPINFINDDIKYKLLDESEQKFRENFSGNNPTGNEFSVKILKRELRLFSSYAAASQAVSSLKGIGN